MGNVNSKMKYVCDEMIRVHAISDFNSESGSGSGVVLQTGVKVAVDVSAKVEQGV